MSDQWVSFCVIIARVSFIILLLLLHAQFAEPMAAVLAIETVSEARGGVLVRDNSYPAAIASSGFQRLAQ